MDTESLEHPPPLRRGGDFNFRQNGSLTYSLDRIGIVITKADMSDSRFIRSEIVDRLNFLNPTQSS